MWTPGDSFDGCLVAGELMERFSGSCVVLIGPNHELVVVASTCKELVVEGPFETTDLLLVTLEARDELASNSQVSVQD